MREKDYFTYLNNLSGINRKHRRYEYLMAQHGLSEKDAKELVRRWKATGKAKIDDTGVD